MRYLRRVRVDNFLSLQRARVALGDLNVLVGPNGAGKTNFLRVVQFLGDTARLDLGPAIHRWGGFDRLRFRGEGSTGGVRIHVEAKVTRHASDNAPDEYTLSFWMQRRVLRRTEAFMYKRTRGAGRRITVRGRRMEIVDDDVPSATRRELAGSSAALSTLPRLGRAEGADQVEAVAQLFQTFRVFEVDAVAARRPAPLSEGPVRLESDAANLAAFLHRLSTEHAEVFDLLQEDLAYILPGLRAIRFEPIGGATEAVAVRLEERGLTGSTPLGAASFGTIRALALLAMLHDPDPPKLTCVEEVDHGLHPHALDRIVLRLRGATRRTQLLLATHSPALVNRLDPSELIVCERDPESGASMIPAVDPREVAACASAAELGLGELWFSGVLGGVP